MKYNTTQPAISLIDVGKNFGGLKAVQHVNMDVACGERRLIIGTNGAGKTTLFNMITGELTVSSGAIHLFGDNVNKMAVARRTKLGVRRTYQTSALFNNISTRENLYLALLGCEKTLAHLNIFKAAHKNKSYIKKIEDAAHDFSITDLLEKTPSELSHGDRRRVELCMATITNPKILLFDEPGAGLSAEERKQIIRIIRELSRDITIVIIEHDMEIAFAVADFVTVMHDGEVVAEGYPDEIKTNELVREIYLGGADKNVGADS